MRTILLTLTIVVAAALAPAASARSDVKVFLVKGERVSSVSRSGTTLRSALRSLVAGPTSRERTRGFSSEIPARTVLHGVKVRDGVATVDLSRRFEKGGGSLSMTTRLKQVVYTATAFRGVRSVRIALNGKLATAIGGEGVLVDRPLTRKTFR